MNRRGLLKGAGGALLAPALGASPSRRAAAASPLAATRRTRPSDPEWPSDALWQELSNAAGGRLVKVRPTLAACAGQPDGATCDMLFKELKNPYFIGDDPSLTQSLGWVGAWTSAPSAYAVAARETRDVVAAVNFAREHKLRLVVKGGGHSYQGTSNAPDSLLAWTRAMNAVTLHDAFVGQGCAGSEAPRPAVSIGAGAMWMQAYDAVTTKGGRYVQGGGCATVGVAGLVQGGGFGSFSKRYGLAAASLIEAEIVTADGEVRIANACAEPELFWGLKGGGGGSLGVVTRLTLATHELPSVFGGANVVVKASSDAAYRRLISRFLEFYTESLFNPHWGEQARFRPDNVLAINMVFQGLTQDEARATWQPFLSWVTASPSDFTLGAAPLIIGIDARHFWDAPLLMKLAPGLMLKDDRPGAPDTNAYWASNRNEAGQVLHGYRSAWLPAPLLQADQRETLAEAMFAASRHWPLSLHVNKGLAGAPAEAIAAARNTAVNPAVLDAFALAICAAEGPPAFPGIKGHEPDLAAARHHAQAIDKAMGALAEIVPDAGSYVSESDFFLKDWQRAFWGANHKRLAAVKEKYDPDGLFFVHHGVGSEQWSADGFVRTGAP